MVEEVMDIDNEKYQQTHINLKSVDRLSWFYFIPVQQWHTSLMSYYQHILHIPSQELG